MPASCGTTRCGSRARTASSSGSARAGRRTRRDTRADLAPGDKGRVSSRVSGPSFVVQAARHGEPLAVYTIRRSGASAAGGAHLGGRSWALRAGARTMETATVQSANVPSGTVTFLFSDIEGSTRRWEQQPEAMQAALARHDALLRGAIEGQGGYVFKTIGDAFCATFETAQAALAATLAAQRALDAEPWGAVGPLRVRMALHTGAAEERDG